MDQSQLYPGKARFAQYGAGLLDDGDVRAAPDAHRGHAGDRGPLALVSGHLALARPDDGVPAEWGEAIEGLTKALKIDVQWVNTGQSTSLMEKARRAVGSGNASVAPVFAPWCAVSPTAFQLGQDALPETGALWVASYLFDFGPVCPGAKGAVDLVLMSPCPQACASDDPRVGALPRLSTLASMIRAASAEGRKDILIVVRESARATLAARLLGFDASLNEASINVEFVSIEEAVIKLQRSPLAWDAVIAMPELRGILSAILSQATGVTGPLPLLWFDRGLRRVTSEAFQGSSAGGQLDATALLQSLALLARHSSRQYAAQRFYERWAAVRDSGVVTPARSSSAPYVNEIGEAAFIDCAIRNDAQNKRPVPLWKGVANEKSADRASPHPVQLRLVT